MYFEYKDIDQEKERKHKVAKLKLSKNAKTWHKGVQKK